LATGNGLHPEINPHPEIILTTSGTSGKHRRTGIGELQIHPDLKLQRCTLNLTSKLNQRVFLRGTAAALPSSP
jgi:hypothetical protein